VSVLTPEGLLASLQAAGATLVRGPDGTVKVSGAKVPDALLAALREQRTAVIEVWERQRQADRDRYGRVPPADAPLLAREMDLPVQWKRRIEAHVLRQPRVVHAWVMARALDYFEQFGFKPDDCDWRACVDAIAWQRMSGGHEAAQFVVDLPTKMDMGL
jgi:hypothetical protein